MGKILCALIMAVALGTVMVTAVQAQETLTESNVSLQLAQRVAEAALNQCREDGFRVSVAVVDRAEVLKVLLRDDGTGPHTPDSAFRKAYTAASLRRSTGELATLVDDVPATEGLRDMNENILILAGGLPIEAGGGVVGGIGVGGAAGGQLDEACARVGLDAGLSGDTQ